MTTVTRRTTLDILTSVRRRVDRVMWVSSEMIHRRLVDENAAIPTRATQIGHQQSHLLMLTRCCAHTVCE